MARRNNLFLFAWLCAVALPIALQLIAGTVEEVRTYLADYYGAFTLYMLFTLTYGFATVFVCYYQITSYDKAGTLDLLRVSGIDPREVVLGAFLQLQTILAPPVVGFALIMLGYLLLEPREGQLHGIGGPLLAGGGMVMLLTQALLGALMCTGLYRRAAPLALVCALLVLPLNVSPVVVLYALHVSWYLFLLSLLAALGVLLLVANRNLAALWPPQRMPRRGA